MLRSFAQPLNGWISSIIDSDLAAVEGSTAPGRMDLIQQQCLQEVVEDGWDTLKRLEDYKLGGFNEANAHLLTLHSGTLSPDQDQPLQP